MEFKVYKNKVIYVDDNNHELAHVLFPMTKDGYVDIKETKVDPSLQGQGIAAKLLEHAYQVIKSHGYPAKATCSYAVNWFNKHPDRQDILIKEEGK